ncbi:hypothetical protein DEIGR_101471 [Deinococcus grandis]|uniref:Uncharacterized protein n=1 Tax=Deinococcus grandis TaxID=57498 RepID=A0A100HIL6_9DEIO|nr:hypothetical protein [Deinococcus grandis]BBN95058.1 hypothetical protein DEGR_17910 [Deinococcus grandis]GAQ21444.1 hypothetical protein DEIGR_101471 [Deinococcus grandis]
MGAKREAVSGAPGSRTVPVVIVNADRGAPWEVFALACALLFLAFRFRRVAWARWALTGAGVLALIVAGVLWAALA